MKELLSDTVRVTVSYSRDTREYKVTPWYVKAGVWKAHQPAAYFTPDKADAWRTAHVMYKTFKAPQD